MKQFLDAVSVGNVLLVKQFLNSNQISLIEVKQGLILSSQKGYKDVLELLIKKSPAQVCEQVLQNVIKNNHSSCLRCILQERRQEITIKDWLKYSLLANSNIKIINLFLKEISKESISQNEDLLLLTLEKMSDYFHKDYAQDFDKRHRISIFLDKIPTLKSESILKNLTTIPKKRNLLKYLLWRRKIGNVHFEDDYLFRKGCKFGDKDLVVMLINLYDVDIHARNSEAQRRALQHGHSQIVDFLNARSVSRSVALSK
jgi:hypothetical protein